MYRATQLVREWNERRNRRVIARAAFSLAELLVVAGIAITLMSLLVPTLSRMRIQSQLVTCAGNLRQIGQAAVAYAADSEGWTPRDAFSASNAFFAPHYGKRLVTVPPDETPTQVGSLKGPRVQVDIDYCSDWLKTVPAFHCPATPDGRPLDYVINALDFDWYVRANVYAERTWQRLPDVKNPSTVIHLAEANQVKLGATQLGQYNIVTPLDLPYYNGNPTAGPRMVRAKDARHGGQTALLMFDGHTELRSLNDSASWPLSSLNPYAP